MTPTSEWRDYWIYAWHHNVESRYVGKWLLFPADDAVDSVWTLVAVLTRRGELGFASKVSTIRTRSRHASYVICVYNDDYRNVVGVERIKTVLVSYGLSPRAYKTDYETETKRKPKDCPEYLGVG